MKMYFIKVRNSRQMEVSTTSVGETFKVVDILNSKVLSDEGDTNSISDTESGAVSIGNTNEIQLGAYDWVLVRYGNETFPGEIIKLVANNVEINVMHKSVTVCWKWIAQEDKIFYRKMTLSKTLIHHLLLVHVDNLHSNVFIKALSTMICYIFELFLDVIKDVFILLVESFNTLCTQVNISSY